MKRRSALIVALALSVLVPGLARAHGERSQEPFLRMRSLLFYDCRWSTDRLRLNEELVLTGRFHTFEDWPVDVIGRPDTVYLNTGVPGPVFVRKASYVNGVNLVTSTSLEIGRDYEFKVVLKARAPGTYHVHPMVNVYQGGPILGPGKTVTIEAGGTFTNPVTTLTGLTIDLEHFGLRRVVGWHLLWAAIALGWLVFWLKRPLFVPRWLAIQRGAAAELIRPFDRQVAAALVVLVIGVVFVGNYVTSKSYPITIPLQSSRHRVKPLPVPAEHVDVDLEKAVYEVPGRTVNLVLKVANRSSKPIRLSELTTANVRFLNASVAPGDPDYPRDLIAPSGLVVTPDEGIAPGETRLIEVSATDPVWEVERLALLLYDPDSRFGALLMFRDSAGNRLMTTVGGPIIPTFTREALTKGVELG